MKNVSVFIGAERSLFVAIILSIASNCMPVLFLLIFQ